MQPSATCRPAVGFRRYPRRRLSRVAGLIRDEDIALVRERARIDEVVSGYVTLKHAGGGSQKGLCPFHDEKSPSFNVNPSRGFFHCFGCAEGGDVIAFLMKIDGLSFAEAVERLADKYGVQLRYQEGSDGRPVKREANLRPRMLEAHKVAQAYYAEQLATPDAKEAREFLTAAGSTRTPPTSSGWGSRPAAARSCSSTCARRASRTPSSSPAVSSARGSAVTTTGSGAGCSGRSGRPTATRSASGRGGSSRTTASRRSTSTPPRPRSTRRATCSTASTWPGATSPGRRRRSSWRATPT